MTHADGTDLRRSILALDGHLLAVGDSKQIEARTNAWFCGQHDLLEEFRQGKDPYKRMAATIFNKPIDKVNGKQRFVGKTAILQLGYGAGSEGFCISIRKKQEGFSNYDAALTVSTYRAINAKIAEMWGTLSACLNRMTRGESFNFKLLRFEPERVILPNGMALIYKDLNYDHGQYTYLARPNKRTKLYGGKLLENIIQALARIIVFEQKLVVAQRYRVLMSTHDELVALLKQRQQKQGLAFLPDALSQPPD